MIGKYFNYSINFAFYIILHNVFCFSDGWEKLGLYEYYKAKNSAKKQKEDAIAENLREKSRSPSPIVLPSFKDKSPVRKKRYRRLEESNTINIHISEFYIIIFSVEAVAQNLVVQPEELQIKKVVHHQLLTVVVEDVLRLGHHHLLRLLNEVPLHLLLEGKKCIN